MTLDEPAFPQAGLADEDDVLMAADEVALGQGFDLQAGDGGVEGPVEGAQRQGFAEVGLLDEPFDAALAAEAGLIGEQAMQEVEVREAGILGVLRERRRVARPSRGCVAWRSRRGSGHAGSASLPVSPGSSSGSSSGGASSPDSSGESKC